MPQPQRPFVPHRTPSNPRPAQGLAEFHLARPFVPGSERSAIHSAGAAREIESTSESTGAELPSIEEFLEQTNTAAVVGAEASPESYDGFAAQDELPPVEHFLDPLPPVSHFAEDFPSQFSHTGEPSLAKAAGADPAAEEGWLESTWQNYDWRAAASLGETGEAEASTAWAATDWDQVSPRPTPSRPTAAQAIASALDEIARRIRDGELVVPPAAPDVAPDPATIAATLASLLGVRK